MPSNDGLIFHFTCLVYVPYLGKLYDLKNQESSLKLHMLSMLGS